ncbi:glycosyltransferase family 4 protein [Polyangium mundeleinium]|uniref:Glycosyltransferase family 4 protein n=1 Tax=Polyangium mundeleinium TaxID=2995306 RepID=A0ABT5EM63_9BACT|nr:glycosyltransferase family 4 protein [Polyangium mundeleinium]MDC0742554.1 glycosyltransferase family 4 protein [Polyangium mundeleinium]
MRIAMISTPFIRMPPIGYGGTELFCYELAEELDTRGHAVTVFTTGDSITSCRKRALYHRPVWPPTAADEVNHVAWALAEIARSTFDVVHLNSPHGVPLSGFLRVPIVYTLHHHREESFSRIYASHPQVYHVAISQRQLDLEVPLARARVIHHGLSPNRYPPSLRDDGYLAHIGRYCEEKGTHLALDLARLVGMPIHLGGRTHPQDRAFCEEYIAPRLDLPGVLDHGEVDHEQKIRILSGARALVCPLLWEEPFGLVAVEAMLCGTPVIGFARGSFPEIVDEGVTGFLVPPDDLDALARVACSPELAHFDRLQCARRARDRFTTSVMASAYESVYRRAVALGHAARARVA